MKAKNGVVIEEVNLFLLINSVAVSDIFESMYVKGDEKFPQSCEFT